MIAGAEPLAHSAPEKGRDPQTYAAHVRNVRCRARTNAGEMCRYKAAGGDDLIRIVDDAAAFHDTGKLDSDTQARLRRGRNERLCWDHIDAGVAHLMSVGAEGAAWLVRAHHSPGLPTWAEHFATRGRKLRGRRSGHDYEPHESQIAHTDRHLPEYLAAHEASVGRQTPAPLPIKHGLSARLALSCLVDADHSDAACFDTGRKIPDPPAPRWEKRLASLDRYVRALPPSGSVERDRNRADFYDACRYSPVSEPLIACEGPVGLGKTTAITAYLIRTATEHEPRELRRLFIVAPYTNVISQTVGRLRKALILDGERGDEVIAEHHHRADFQDIDTRDLAVSWRAPVVVTTAVQFFETLASNKPGALRKLHALPGSVVFLDEAHAALPTALWGQNWRWISELASEWSCRFVFASGSLARFWEKEAVVGDAKRKLPELTPPELATRVLRAETRRIRYRPLGRLNGVEPLVAALIAQEGPRLVILNTVQSAAVVARTMAEKHDVLHLSTALCPRDRDAVLKRITERLARGDADWTLVATSCIESGVDFSFRSAFRERFSAASLIQVGGRVNRHSIYDPDGGGTVYDFMLDPGNGIVAHPAARKPAQVLGRLFEEGRFDGAEIDPAELVTRAMTLEVRDRGSSPPDLLCKAERERDYPDVAERGKVIVADTRLVVVDDALRRRIEHRDRVSFRELLPGSVQIWATKIGSLGLDPIKGRPDVYWFPHAYDPDFLGYMAGVLEIKDIGQRGFAIYD